jgi:GNAT superfamily N-acetyltransferase
MPTQPDRYLIRRATPQDLPDVLAILASAARWMHAAGWTAWRPEGFPAERITPGIDEGTVWVLTTREQVPLATIALDRHPDPEYTAPEALAVGVGDYLDEGWFGHRLARWQSAGRRGLGTLLVSWSVDWTYRQGGKYRLLNTARDAKPLQAFYQSLGFRHLAEVHSTGRRSGSLWVRDAEEVPAVHERITELT